MVKGFGSDDCGPLTADLSAPSSGQEWLRARHFWMPGPLLSLWLLLSNRSFLVPNAICYFCGMRVIKAPIFGVPIPVAKSYPGVAGNKPLLLVV